RLTMTVGATERPVFTGRIREFNPDPRWGYRICTLDCVDLTYMLQGNRIGIPVQVYVRADQLIETAITAAGHASTKSALSERGIGQLQISADRWDYQWTEWFMRQQKSETVAYDVVAQAALSGWGRWFVDGAGEWRFYNRHHRAFGESPDYYLYDDPPAFSESMFMTAAKFRTSVETVKNELQVAYYPRTIGTTFEVLARIAPGSPLSIDPGQTRNVVLSYRDPSGSTSQIGAYSVTPVGPGGGLDATYERTGDGPSANGDVSVTGQYNATRANLFITNNNLTQPIWIHRLEVRGVAVRMRESQRVTVFDLPSQTAYQLRQLALSCSLISQEYEARRLAEYLLNQLRFPQQEMDEIVLHADQGDDVAALIRDLELLDTIGLTHARAGLAVTGVVAQLHHSMSAARGHRLTLALEPVPAYLDGSGAGITNPFRIGSPINNSAYDMVY
ncbi:MAG TPA: hypothetical protein PK954_05435, partial [Anaerolineales bacterium]|nr:hypothetical protein [Anaerolineales bacterium]